MLRVSELITSSSADAAQPNPHAAHLAFIALSMWGKKEDAQAISRMRGEEQVFLIRFSFLNRKNSIFIQKEN